MNFLGALVGIIFASIVILPVIMLMSIVAYEFWPVLLFLGWAAYALLRHPT